MKKNNEMNRMETLKANGIDTNKYFSTLLPILKQGQKIEITLNEMGAPVVSYFDLGGDEFVDSFDEEDEEDEIINEIYANGYVKNTKIHRRWVMAQMFRMLNYRRDCNLDKTDYTHSDGYTAYINNTLSYKYTLDMMLEEVRVIAKLEASDTESFEERTMFFNRRVVNAVVIKFYNDLIDNGCTTEVWEYFDEYFDNIDPHVNENYLKVYYHLRRLLRKVYSKVKVGHILKDCKKSKEWVDAYKGAGAFYTLKNMIMFHNCFLVRNSYAVECGETAEFYTREESLKTLKVKTEGYLEEGNAWKLMGLLKQTIRENKFDFYAVMAEKYNK